MKRVAILGSTGSIGTQALEVIRTHGLEVSALAAYHQVEMLAQQAKAYHPSRVCIFDESKKSTLESLLEGEGIQIFSGMDGLCEIAKSDDTDIVLTSVVGMVGLLPTLTAIRAKKDIALANKETLVAGGELVMREAREHGVHIYPVDSEHSAIFQSLQGNEGNAIHKIILTASGGPFYGRGIEELTHIKAEYALKHPNWDMGNKITIDSATLMNKGLEFIEARWLFDVEPNQIEILIHRQSVLHSAVEFEDYAVVGQMGVPDMKIPIQYALLYPKRVTCPTKPLNLLEYGTLTFEKPDPKTFDCLQAAIDSIEMGGLIPCVVNAANEIAVDLFLKGKIGFLDIPRLIRGAMQGAPSGKADSYESIRMADTYARDFVKSQF